MRHCRDFDDFIRGATEEYETLMKEKEDLEEQLEEKDKEIAALENKIEELKDELRSIDSRKIRPYE